MSTDQNNQNPDNENESQSQNNNGNIGREAGVEKEGEGSFSNISKDNHAEKPVNEEGTAENQEPHWTGNHGQKSSNRPTSSDRDSFSDQNISNGAQQNEGRNHVTNAGGTSQEDLEKGKTGLREESKE